MQSYWLTSNNITDKFFNVDVTIKSLNKSLFCLTSDHPRRSGTLRAPTRPPSCPAAARFLAALSVDREDKNEFRQALSTAMKPYSMSDITTQPLPLLGTHPGSWEVILVGVEGVQGDSDADLERVGEGKNHLTHLSLK